MLRAVFNFAESRYKRPNGKSLFAENPTDVLKETKTRYKIQRRRMVIAAADMPDWWRAVHELRNPVARDYLVFLALTGTRREEAAKLRWEDVDFRAGSFHLPDPKNRIPVTLPLPRYVAGLISPRRQESGWVFSAPTGKTGYLNDPRKSIAQVRQSSGVRFSPHDLRRGFASIANGLAVSIYSVKALLNHQLNGADITHQYDVPDLGRLQAASAKIEPKLLTLAGVDTGTVVPITGKNQTRDTFPRMPTIPRIRFVGYYQSPPG